MRHPSKKLIFVFITSTVLFSMSLIGSAAAQSDSEPDDQTEQAGVNYTLSMPLVFRPPDPPPVPPVEGTNKTLFCSNVPQDIPDNFPEGIISSLRIEDPRYIADLDVRLDIDHSWVGDLVVTLQHQESARIIELINRPGVPTTNNKGCKLDNVRAILDDDVSLPVEGECSSYPAAVGINSYIEAAIAGSYFPDQPLSTFDGDSIGGTWILTVSDVSQYDKGHINQWCLAAKLVDTPDVPPEEPPPTGLPRQASISGVTGQGQFYDLDCESRSAVDWARYFSIRYSQPGWNIDELAFFHGLPETDNPDSGFVGPVDNELWGQIPPHPYGVHAEPIAKRLRQYGLPADAERNITWNHLKKEIAEGDPVIVWILGSGYPVNGYDYVVNGIPVYYQSADGYITTVARYEHTVVLTSYTQDSVTYLNGGRIIQKSLKQFLESWSALGNMAVVFQP